VSDDAGVFNPKALSEGLQMQSGIAGRTATGWYAEARPLRLQQEVRLSEADSFLRYVERFKEPGAVIFYSRPGRCFKAVLDYHEPVECGEAIARWCGHVVTYTMQFSRQYMEWIGHHRVPMTPQKFHSWVDEHCGDFENPDIENSRRHVDELDAWVKTAIADTEGAREDFQISLPVLNGDESRKPIDLRVEYWQEPDKPSAVRYMMLGLDSIIEEASARIRRRIEDESGVPVYAEH
jgi:hypothetical protein